MKKRFRLSSFLSGVILALLISALSVSALAASGALTITVDPIQVMVNGEIFQPKDVQGRDVMVFAYNGTTYAPVRALAEAYGLEVNYDSARHMAVVNDPRVTSSTATTGYEAFASQWTVTEKPVTNYGNEKIFMVTYSGTLSMKDFKTWWKSLDPKLIQQYAEQMAADAQSLVPGYDVTAYFCYGTYTLGNALAFDGYQISNFEAAEGWIK